MGSKLEMANRSVAPLICCLSKKKNKTKNKKPDQKIEVILTPEGVILGEVLIELGV